MSDESLLSHRNTSKRMAYGGAATLFAPSGGVLTQRSHPPVRAEKGARMILKRTRLLLTAAGMVMLWGVEVSIPSAAETPDATKVVVKDFKFMPTPLTVKAGSTVTWTNKDDDVHTVVSDTGAFKSGAMDTNDSFSFKFDEPGTYHFTCSLHPRMVGTIVVQ